MSKRRTQAPGHNGSAEDIAAMHVPYFIPSSPNTEGIFMGLKDDGSEFNYNPFEWMDKSIIPNLIQFNSAKIGYGKTTLLDMIAARYSAQEIGDENGTYEMRIWADNVRKLHGKPELQRLAEFFDSKMIGVDKRINPLASGYGLRYQDQLQFLEGMMTIANNNQELDPDVTYAIQVVTDRMFRLYPEESSLDVLSETLPRLDIAMEQDYRDSLGTLEQRLGKEALSSKLALDMAKPRYIDEEVLRKAGWMASKLVLKITDGTAGGGYFGGLNSNAEDLQQRAVVMDYSDAPDSAITIMQSLNWLVRTSANARQDRRFMYQIDLHDENWKLWNYLTYANAMYAYLKQIRSYETLVLLSSQRPNDYATVGEEKSPQREKATKMLSDVGSMYIGHQEASDANDIAHMLNLSGDDEKRLTKLHRGEWGVKLGDDNMFFIDTNPAYNRTISDLSFSNQALRTLLNKGKKIEDEKFRNQQSENERGEEIAALL